jgi:single-stranded-DNA-specific exonuclease
MSFQPTHHILRRTEPEFPSDSFNGLHPLLARIVASRGIASADELEHSLGQLLPFTALKGVEQAVALLAEALEKQWRILIIGDFDADGATSTALAVRALRLFGTDDVDFLVPNRFEYGYGLTPEIVEVAAQRKPDLIVTVDNGIASLRGVAAAQAHGIRVLITDHHLPPSELPAAEAIVNPNQPGDEFPSKNLAGVGVIFYLMMALRGHLRENGWFEKQGMTQPNLAQLLDLVALGTVADVVPLDRNNRILVAQGLARIRGGQACPGILALCEVAKRSPQRLLASDLGYAVGPRLNAAGRMHDMSIGIACLLADDMVTARKLALQMDQLNYERRGIENEMRDEALEELQRLQLDETALPFGLCLYNPEWHQGVIGILASRIKDRVHRPVIVFTLAGEGMLKGSARSVSGVHIRDAIDAVASRYPDLLDRFGGHAMAAGLSLPEANLETFKQAFDEEVRRHLSEDDLHGVLLSDGELASTTVDLDLVEHLRTLLPWGQGIPTPLFDGTFDVIEQRIVGERHLKFLLRWSDGNGMVDAIAFNVDDELLHQSLQQITVAYRVDINEWQGRRSVQLMIEAFVGAVGHDI